jgi:hypothetical protein
MTHDDVSNPQHYNKQGIEVIDVIEAYELPYHLGNVIKYVCRHSYKGKPLQDLQKALWYLARYVEDMEDCLAVEEHGHEYPGTPAQAHQDFCESLTDGYGRVLRASPPVNIDGVPFDEGCRDDQGRCGLTGKVCESEADCIVDEMDGERDACLDDDDCHDYGDTTLPQSVVDALYIHTPPDRIAGDTGTTASLKDEYYEFNRHEIVGYCAQCDAELPLTEAYLSNQEGFDGAIKFCSYSCVLRLREWQAR